VYSEAWSWPVTTVVVGLLSLGWFLIGILAGRRTVKKKSPQGRPSRREREQPAARKSTTPGAVELYVGNLSYDTTDGDLRAAFAKFGQVVSIRLIENKYNGKSKGYGFLEMGDGSQAQAAIQAFNGREFKGRKIVVSEAKSRSREDGR